MMLCGVSVVFNSLGDVLGLVSCKRSSENGQVLVGFQSTEAFGCLHHAGGGPAQRHRGVSPSALAGFGLRLGDLSSTRAAMFAARPSNPRPNGPTTPAQPSSPTTSP